MFRFSRFVRVLLQVCLLLSLSLSLGMTAQKASAATICDAAQFVSDITVPDGTAFTTGATFTKIWRLKNVGTCTWTTSYSLVFSSGEQMGTTASVPMPKTVAPGQTVDLSVNLTAPATPGTYRGYWQLKNASGVLFGIGLTADKTFWVQITVTAPQQNIVAFDFTANICDAQWSFSNGGISCPVNQNKLQNGYPTKVDNAALENGTLTGTPGILVIPETNYNGVIRGAYTVPDIFPNDHFQALVGCEAGAVNCYVTFTLEYLTPSGTLVTIWKTREKFDGLNTPVDVILNSVAGKKNAKLVLTVSAAGPSTGDRALWINPRIVRAVSGSVVTPVPVTVTPVPPPSTSGCDRAQFISDITVPDGTVFQPNTAFTKTWRLKNVGTCTWTTAYSLVFVSGDRMGAPDSVLLPQTVVPGQTVDVGLNLTSPSVAGDYRGYWEFKNASGGLFGIGTNADKPFWVDITVSGSASGTTAAYDFVSNVCAAQWSSGSGALPCPGTDGDTRGFVLSITNPKLENGNTSSQPGLLTFPQNTYNGYIQGIYPAFSVQSGDHFQSIINCEYGATDCYVIFRLDYQIGSGPVQTFWAFSERYDGLYYQADIDLSPLAGQSVRFILSVLANGYATGDRALWVAPRIYRPSGTSSTPSATPTPIASTPTPVPTVSGTDTSNWNTYQNTKYGFSFKFPPGSVVSSQTDTSGRIYLPILTAGTNLKEKYLDISVAENSTTCSSPLTQGYAPGSFQSQQVTINGVNFVQESGGDGAAGNFYDWVAYSTLKGTNCISLGFVLHSLNPGNFSTPPPTYDKAAESAVFSTIMSTYASQ